MKKIISMLIMLVLACTMVACGDELEDYQKVFFINVVNNTDHEIQGIRRKASFKAYEEDELDAYRGPGYAYKVGEVVSAGQYGQPEWPIEKFEDFEIDISVIETDGTVSEVVKTIPIDVEYYREYIFSLTNKGGVYDLELIDTREPVWLDELEKEKNQ